MILPFIIVVLLWAFPDLRILAIKGIVIICLSLGILEFLICMVQYMLS